MVLLKLTRSITLAALLSATLVNAGPIDPKFSLDPASPAIDGNITPDDILKTGPVVYIQGPELGLFDDFFAGEFDNLADFSFGKDPIPEKPSQDNVKFFFSVDRVAVGLPGTPVFQQAAPDVESAAGDVYKALPPFGSNSLFINEVDLGLTYGFFGDDIDGLELDTEPTPTTYFNFDRLSKSNEYGALDYANDIWRSDGDGIKHLYIEHPAIYLLVNDAIDGLALDLLAQDRRVGLFSLDPFSPSTYTYTGLDYIPCVRYHMSPADVCLTHFDGQPYSLWASAADIGLRDDDNVDALDTLIPEPGPLSLLTVGLLCAWFKARLWVRGQTLGKCLQCNLYRR